MKLNQAANLVKSAVCAKARLFRSENMTVEGVVMMIYSSCPNLASQVEGMISATFMKDEGKAVKALMAEWVAADWKAVAK